MKAEKLQDAIGMVGDDLVVDAKNGNTQKKSGKAKRLTIAAVAAAMALVIALGVIFAPFGQNMSLTVRSSAIVLASYPKMTQYPSAITQLLGEFSDDSQYDKWRDDCRALKEPYYNLEVNINSFVEKTVPELLSAADGENLVYSPLNVYMALAMLAEMTDENSREQLLSLLGASDIEELRLQANAMWLANYCDDGAVTSIPAASVWLSDDIEYNHDTMQLLSDNYYASSFSGDMSSESYSAAYRSWLNEQTGGMLKDQIGDSSFDDNTLLALATTIYYRAKWNDEFNADKTERGTFHAANGDMSCDFMHSSSDDVYYWAEKFGAVRKSFDGNTGSMWFILPDEGVGVEELINDAQLAQFINSNGDWENSKRLIVNLAVPKFDVSSEAELGESLKNLGITDVFDVELSDFTPTTQAGDLVVSSVTHGVRVKIDEEGCTAASYTELMFAGAAEPPTDEIDFVLDRPFIFVITSSVGTPLFVGVINVPV